jgi:hypothetical protein
VCVWRERERERERERARERETHTCVWRLSANLCMNTCVYVHYTHTHTHTHTHTRVCVEAVCKPLHEYMRRCPLYTNTHTHTHTCHPSIYIFLSVHIYIHMYIYFHAYTYAFIHRMQGAPLHAPPRARGSWAGEPIRCHRGVGRCSGQLHRCSSRQGPLGHSAQAWPAARGS